MVMKIALILSVIFLLAAAIFALSLIKRTRNNLAWLIISIGFFTMSIKLLVEVLIVFDLVNLKLNNVFFCWAGLIASMLMLISLLFIQRIFNIQKKYDDARIEREAEVVSAIVKAEENERTRFAKELHDSLGPLLSSIKMSVSTIKKQLGKGADLTIIDNTEKLIDESIFSIKEISNNISPHILTNFGLNKALQSFITKIQVSNNINIILNSNLEDRRYDYNVEVVFYRVICELIANTLKHASAQRITIDLFEDNNELILEYIDDGIGFSLEKVEQSGQGMGLSNMRSRISSLNGSCNFKTRKEKGVCISINVKIQ